MSFNMKNLNMKTDVRVNFNLKIKVDIQSVYVNVMRSVNFSL